MNTENTPNVKNNRSALLPLVVGAIPLAVSSSLRAIQWIEAYQLWNADPGECVTDTDFANTGDQTMCNMNNGEWHHNMYTEQYCCC